jgi:phosphoserine phosphatase
MLFILPACKALGIEEVIGTELNFINGRYSLGENCRGDEKFRRIKERFPASRIREAYSDNLDDLGLLHIADKGFVVKRGDIVPVNASGDAHKR